MGELALKNPVNKIYNVTALSEKFGTTWTVLTNFIKQKEIETPLTEESYIVVESMLSEKLKEYDEFLLTGKDYITVEEYAKEHNLSVNKVRGAFYWGYFEHKVWKYCTFNSFLQGAKVTERYIHKDTDFYNDRQYGDKFEYAKKKSNSYYNAKYKRELSDLYGTNGNPLDMIDIYLKTAKRQGHEVDFENKTIDGFEIVKTKDNYLVNGKHITHYIYNEKFDFDDWKTYIKTHTFSFMPSPE